ncbi:MAG: YceD family protein [Nitrospiraceae bacterium]
MALPRPHLTEIPDSGLSLACGVQPDELELGPDDGRSHGELSLSVEIAKAGTGLSVTGVLTGTVLRKCVRCLTEYEDAVSLPFAVEYRPEDVPPRGRHKSPGAEARDLPEEEDEVYPFDGDRLELAGMLREQVILATPMQPLCHEDCLGLCPVCGENLNERQCGCPDEGRESPFVVLKAKAGRQRKG